MDFITHTETEFRLAEPEIDSYNPDKSSNRADDTGAAGNMGRHLIEGQNNIGFHTPLF